MPETTERKETIAGSDNVSITVAGSARTLIFGYHPPGPSENPLTIYVALGTRRQIGAAVLPFSQHLDGSTVFLPFKCDLLLSAEIRAGQITCFLRKWEQWRWSAREPTHDFEVSEQEGEFLFRIPRTLLNPAQRIDFTIYTKDPGANDGWGWFWGCSDRSVASGIGDKYIPHSYKLELNAEASTTLATQYDRSGVNKARIRIYQLFVRLFSNTNETRQRNGTLAQNGAGRFADINDKAL